MDDGLCSFIFFFAAGVRNSIGVDFLLLSFPFRDMEEEGRMVNWSTKLKEQVERVGLEMKAPSRWYQSGDIDRQDRARSRNLGKALKTSRELTCTIKAVVVTSSGRCGRSRLFSLQWHSLRDDY